MTIFYNIKCYFFIGDCMKNVNPVLIAVIIGIVFSLFIFLNKKEELKSVFSDSEPLSFFQLGLFKNVEYARDLKNNNPGAIIIKSDGYYYVYSAILKNNNNVEKLKNYYDEKNINYYIKTINVNNAEFLDLLNKYEIMIEKVGSESMININNEILNTYKGMSNEQFY